MSWRVGSPSSLSDARELAGACPSDLDCENW